MEFLKKIVRSIFEAFKVTEDVLLKTFPTKQLKKTVPDEIFFITSQELVDLYPNKRPRERVN